MDEAHDVPYSIWVESSGGPSLTGSPLAPTTRYVVQTSKSGHLLNTFAVYALPGLPARSYIAYFQWISRTWTPSTRAALDHAGDDDFSYVATADHEKLLSLNPAAAQAPVPVLTGNPFKQIALAESIAYEMHAGQLDKLDVDYIRHPQAVASAFDPGTEPIECAAAWLHDVLEDTDIDVAELRYLEIQEPVLRVVELLTRSDDVPDETYYARIAADPVARAVKLADIAHNLHPDRVAALTPAQVARAPRPQVRQGPARPGRPRPGARAMSRGPDHPEETR